jgi:hypothetical protein
VTITICDSCGYKQLDDLNDELVHNPVDRFSIRMGNETQKHSIINDNYDLCHQCRLRVLRSISAALKSSLYPPEVSSQ